MYVTLLPWILTILELFGPSLSASAHRVNLGSDLHKVQLGRITHCWRLEEEAHFTSDSFLWLPRFRSECVFTGVLLVLLLHPLLHFSPASLFVACPTFSCNVGHNHLWHPRA